MSGRIVAVIVSGGLSSRMIDFKPLLPLGSATVLGRAAELLREGGVRDILVVAGHRANEVQAEASRLGVRCVVNLDFRRGMFSSVLMGLTGLAALADAVGGFDGVFVLPVDIPLVKPATVRTIIKNFRGEPVAYPVFRGQRGHPPLIAAQSLPFVLGWDGTDGLRGALEALERSHGAGQVAVADENILFDLDTPWDYREALHRAARSDRPTQAETEALLEIQTVGERGLAHARAVAQAALAMARALNAARIRADGTLPGPTAPLDLALVESAALLHDVAKGRPDHEAEGGRILDSAGFPDAARIVEAHRDLDLPPEAPFTEREVVYLADKFVSGDRLVDIRTRFQEKLDRFGADPEAAAAILGRRDRALAVLARLEVESGKSIEVILAETIIPHAGFSGSMNLRPGGNA